MGEPALLLPPRRPTRPALVAIHQPNLLPRLKVLQKVVAAGSWVVLDDVQFARHDWQARCRLRPLHQPQREFWVSVPVRCPDGRTTLISDVRIGSPAKMMQIIEGSIRQAYRRSIHWRWIARYLVRLQQRISASLTEFCVETTMAALSMLGLSVDVVLASELDGVHGARSRRLLSLCHHLDAPAYLCGSGGRSYLDRALFERGGVAVLYHEWKTPTVEGEPARLPWRDVSFLDMIARCGPLATRNHLADWRSSVHDG